VVTDNSWEIRRDHAAQSRSQSKTSGTMGPTLTQRMTGRRGNVKHLIQKKDMELGQNMESNKKVSGIDG